MKQEITFISDQASFIESLSTVIREIVREELVNPKVKVKNKMERDGLLKMPSMIRPSISPQSF